MCEGGAKSQETVSDCGILELGRQTALSVGVIWLLSLGPFVSKMGS